MEMKKAQSQPTYVCASCGKDYGVWYRLNDAAREKLIGVGWYDGSDTGTPSWTPGRCGVCQKVCTVTTPDAYGGLVEYWQPSFAFD